MSSYGTKTAAEAVKMSKLSAINAKTNKVKGNVRRLEK